MKRFEEAIKQFDLCRELRPNHAPTLQLRGLSLRGLSRFEEYLADSMAAHALDPNSAETRTNIGSALLSLGRCDEALGWFNKALEIRPNLTEALNNKAVSLGQLHRFDDAFALYDRMKARKLNNTRTEWILSHLHLLSVDGQFRGRLGRTRNAIEDAFGNLSEISSAGAARR